MAAAIRVTPARGATLAIRGNETSRLSRIKTAINPEARAQDKSALKRKYFRTIPYLTKP
jgi:hypothetical protein